VATDRQGTWVAVWESNDTLGDTLGTDPDILMAHSIDGGAHWSVPHGLDPDAGTDTRRDVAPQLATDGAGMWNVVWAGLGGTLGADSDIMRAGGRERCGNGSVDPGEQCDDGNTQDGDACPASCEFPPPPTPIVTATPGGSGSGSATGGATPTPGAGGSGTPSGGADGTAMPSADVSATPSADVSAMPSADVSATPSADATATPSADVSATPSADASSTPTEAVTATPGGTSVATPTVTASPDPAATATPTPSNAGSSSTPTPRDGQPSGTPTPVGGPGGTSTGHGGAATPTAGVTPFGGGLASATAAKAAVVCQRAVVKAGAQLVGARLSNLASCARAVQRCIQIKPEDPGCLQKASGRCRSALDALTVVDGRTGATLRKRCGGTLALADVLGPAGLGYAALACDEAGAARSLDDLVDCVVGEHACRAATLFEVLQPRAKELMRLPGMSAATLDTIVCLPDHGGDGDTVGDPAGQGKAVEACASAIVKAGTSFVRKRLERQAQCVDGLFSCVQLAPNNGACLPKARARCDQGQATTAAEERKLTSAVAGRCGERVIAYATLRAARAANLDALAGACAAVGVPALDTLADYQQCVLRADACRVEGILRVQAPRVAELMGVVGRSFGNADCGGL